eukprot:6069281-Pyramimonas_sp.AAC.1
MAGSAVAQLVLHVPLPGGEPDAAEGEVPQPQQLRRRDVEKLLALAVLRQRGQRCAEAWEVRRVQQQALVAQADLRLVAAPSRVQVEGPPLAGPRRGRQILAPQRMKVCWPE